MVAFAGRTRFSRRMFSGASRVSIRIPYFLLLMVIAFMAGACAPTMKQVKVSEKAVEAEREKQQEMALSVYLKRYEHLLDVSFPLLTAAADLCAKDAKPVYGFMLHDKETYKKLGKGYQEAAARRYGVGEDVRVLYVHPELPAAKAGLRAGDRVLAINGKSLDGKTAKEAMKILDDLGLPVSRPLLLRIGREGVVQTLSLKGVPACDYSVYLVNRDGVNAYADGKRIVIFSGMMRFTETDEELALVVSHEIAHNALGHKTKRIGNILLGSLLDIAVAATTGANTQGAFGRLGGMAFSKGFEAEADYVGLYVAARAGYEIADAPNFWRRMAVEHPGNIKKNFSATHPSAPERFTALEETVLEIEKKRQNGELLLPEKKQGIGRGDEDD